MLILSAPVAEENFGLTEAMNVPSIAKTNLIRLKSSGSVVLIAIRPILLFLPLSSHGRDLPTMFVNFLHVGWRLECLFRISLNALAMNTHRLYR